MNETFQGSDDPTPKEQTWALVRLTLGITQMAGAVLSVYLLIQNGMNEISLAAVGLTCLCTMVSLLLFGRRPRK